MNKEQPADRRDFWSQYPENESEFLAHVCDPGIHVSEKFDFSPEATIRSEYGGVSQAKLSRSVEVWRAEGDFPDHVDEAEVKRFEEDVRAWNEEHREAVEKVLQRLPAPLFGCHWVRDQGGLIWTRNAGGRSVPDELFFRLWRNDLGYMPRSE